MTRDYVFRCGDCGFMWEANDTNVNERKCESCGSENRTQIKQDEGKFGCTSRMNTHVENTNFHDVHQ